MSKRGITPAIAQKIRIKKGLGEGTKRSRLRVARNLSQRELAKISGVSYDSISKYEGNVNPIVKLDTLCDLCLALNCKITDLLEDDYLIEKFNLVKYRKEERK